MCILKWIVLPNVNGNMVNLIIPYGAGDIAKWKTICQCESCNINIFMSVLSNSLSENPSK